MSLTGSSTSDSSSSESESGSERESPKRRPRRSLKRAPGKKADDMFQFWSRKSQIENDRVSLDRFLSSFKGWSKANTGAHIYPATKTCNWFMDNSVYKSWVSARKSLSLFYLGLQGQGKTYLAKAISRKLAATQPMDVGISFFCEDDKRPKIWDFFTWTIVGNNPILMNTMHPRFRNRDENSPPLSVAEFMELWDGMMQGVPSRHTIYLIIDGIDKCDDDFFREFVQSVEQLHARRAAAKPPLPASLPTLEDTSSSGQVTLKVLFTCRPSESTAVASAFTSRAVALAADTINDIETYVSIRLAKFDDILAKFEDIDTVPKEQGPKEIKEFVTDRAKIYWPFAKSAMDELESRRCIPWKTQNGVNETYIPDSLRQYFDRTVLPILQSVGPEDVIPRMLILLYASKSVGPRLTLAQAADVLKLLLGPAALEQANLIEIIRKRCGGILLAADQGPVMFAHITMLDYVEALVPMEHRMTNMAFVCLKYLLQEQFRDPSTVAPIVSKRGEERSPDKYPFYVFAATGLMEFLSNLKRVDERLLSMLKEFFAEDSPKFWARDQWKTGTFHKTEESVHQGSATVVPLITLPCVAVLEALLPPPGKEASPSKSFAVGNIWKSLRTGFSKRSHSLPLHVTNWPNMDDYEGRTALMWAVASGEPQMVKYILQWPGVKMNVRSKAGGTVFLYSYYGRGSVALESEEELLEIYADLLRHGADPNICDQLGCTPLMLICNHGKEALAELLIENGASVNVADTAGCSALELAYVSGNVGLVVSLLERGADPNVWWSSGHSALSVSIGDGRLDMFQVFLPLADVNQFGECGLAPIHMLFNPAVPESDDRGEMLRLLLTRRDLDLDLVDRMFNNEVQRRPLNALYMAVNAKNYRGLAMLLEAGAFPGRLPRMTGSPLYKAAQDGDASVVELLLAYQAPPNDYSSRWTTATPLAEAVFTGNQEIIAMLLRYGADPTVEEGFGQPGPLNTALRTPEFAPAVVRQLLEAPLPPDVNYVPKDGEPALVQAVDCGSVEAAKLLLEHGTDTSIWLQPNRYFSPIHVAVSTSAASVGERCAIIDILLDHEPGFLNMCHDEGFVTGPPLHAACEYRDAMVVRKLLDRGARPQLLGCHDQESALLVACDCSDLETIRMVLEAAPEMVNVPSYVGNTPLSLACRRGDLRVVELLLKAGADIYHRDIWGKTCVNSGLFAPREKKRPEKTLELLMRYGLEINAPNDGRLMTVLGLAVHSDSVRDVRWLLEHGADPLHCGRSPLPLKEVSWRNALQLVSLEGNGEMVDLLMEPQWGLRQHIADADWHGFTVLPDFNGTMSSGKMVARIIAACEEVGAETGRDILPELMRRPCITGRSPLDFALGETGVTDAARPAATRILVTYVDYLVRTPRRRQDHDAVVDDVCWLLLSLGDGHEAAAAALEAARTSMPDVRRTDRGYELAATSVVDCDACGAIMYEVCRACRLCSAVACATCDVVPAGVVHRHEWLELPLRLGADITSDEVQKTLEGLLASLTDSPALRLASIPEEVPLPESPSSPTDEPPSTDEHPQAAAAALQSSLSLATLHYLNLLSPTKPSLAPYLPLSPAAEASVAPFAAALAPRRRALDRRNLGLEASRARRAQELRHFSRGLRRAYANEAAVAADLLLGDVGGMFEMAERDGEGKGEDGGGRRGGGRGIEAGD